MSQLGTEGIVYFERNVSHIRVSDVAFPELIDAFISGLLDSLPELPFHSDGIKGVQRRPDLGEPFEDDLLEGILMLIEVPRTLVVRRVRLR